MKTKQGRFSTELSKNIISANKTEKFIQLIFYCSFFFICSSTSAASNSNFNSNIKPGLTQAPMSNLAFGMKNYTMLSTYPNDLATTSLLWAKQGGASGGYVNGTGISTDSSGNSYVIGSTTVGLFGQPQNGNYDYLIVKYDQNGYISGSRQVGGTGRTKFDKGTTNGNGISIDNSDNIYVTGNTDVGISGQKQNGYEDYFIAKYDVNGNLKWSRQVGAADGGGTYGQGISVDNLGNIYVTGYTYAGISGQYQNGLVDYFIAKYDVNGNLIWTRQVGSSGGTTYGQGISADNLGNIYVTGYTTVVQDGSFWDYFIAKYDVNGNLIWTRQVGAAGGGSVGNGISADNLGNIYITGSTTVGLSGQKQNGVFDYFIARYDVNGNLKWSRQVGPSTYGATYGQGISADNFGNIYITGNTTAGISGQKQNGNVDYFIAQYDANGNLIWTSQVGSSGGSAYGNGISADNSGNIYVTGYTGIGLSGQKQNGIWDYFIANYINH